MNSKGQIPPVVLTFGLIAIGIILLLAVKPNLLQTVKTTTPNHNETQVSTPTPVFSNVDDINKKLLIDSLPDYLQRYYSDHKKYPSDLSPIIDWLLKFTDQEHLSEAKILQTNFKDFKYTNKGNSYELSTVLSNGTELKAPSVDPRYTDAVVKGDISQLAIMINIFYSNKQRYPKNLEELKIIPDFSTLNIPKQPDGNPYDYKAKSDGYSITGKLTSGEQYIYNYP